MTSHDWKIVGNEIFYSAQVLYYCAGCQTHLWCDPINENLTTVMNKEKIHWCCDMHLLKSVIDA
jgi:hypothetical protein